MIKFIKNLILVMVFSAVCSITTFASEIETPIDITNATEVTNITEEEQVESTKARVSGQARGDWMADVVLEISNPQNGNIGVRMVTSCYYEVDRILMGVYVDELTENNTWNQVDYKVFEFLPEDFSDGKLVEAILDIEITGHEPGWYRLRGLHLVSKGEMDEFYSTETSGIQITNNSIFGDEEEPDEATPNELAE